MFHLLLIVSLVLNLLTPHCIQPFFFLIIQFIFFFRFFCLLRFNPILYEYYYQFFLSYCFKCLIILIFCYLFDLNSKKIVTINLMWPILSQKFSFILNLNLFYNFNLILPSILLVISYRIKDNVLFYDFPFLSYLILYHNFHMLLKQNYNFIYASRAIFLEILLDNLNN